MVIGDAFPEEVAALHQTPVFHQSLGRYTSKDKSSCHDIASKLLQFLLGSLATTFGDDDGGFEQALIGNAHVIQEVHFEIGVAPQGLDQVQQGKIIVLLG